MSRAQSILIGASLRCFKLLPILLCGIAGSTAAPNAQVQINPDCVPLTSAWDNVELTPVTKSGKQALTVAISMLENEWPYYYGFVFLQDSAPIPELKSPLAVQRYFAHRSLQPLQPVPQHEDGVRYYRFMPEQPGHWVIYLLASVQPVDVLERQQVRIQPNIEVVRGGTLFSGASLDGLVEPVDYKACVIPQ